MSKNICLLAITFLLLSISCKKQSAHSVSYIEWSKTYGGSGLDVGNGAAEGLNGRYIIVGYTNSNDGDVQGQNHCTNFADADGKIVQYCGHDDGWVLKLSGSGEITIDTWKSTYGKPDDPLPKFNIFSAEAFAPEPNSDRFTSIDTVSKGIFLIAGQTNSCTNEIFITYPSRGNSRKPWSDGNPFNPTLPWISHQMNETAVSLQLDTLRGTTTDYGWHDSVNCVKALPNDKYAVVGFRESYNSNAGGDVGDAFIITPSNTKGRVIKSYMGGTSYDRLNAVTQIADKSLIAVGQTNSTDIQGIHNRGRNDLWVIKRTINSSGITSAVANMTFGGEGEDIANAVASTSDGGFVVAGQTNSNDGDVSGNHSSRYDAWVIRFDGSMNVVWKMTYGGAFGDEKAKSIIQTPDGGFAFVGQTSSNDGDVIGNHGYGDAWVVKLDKNGKIVWQQTLGGSSEDCANNVIATLDGGLLITGYSFSNDGDISRFLAGGNLWVVKLKRQ